MQGRDGNQPPSTPLSCLPKPAGAAFSSSRPTASALSLFLSGWSLSPHPPLLPRQERSPNSANPHPGLPGEAVSAPQLSPHRRGCALWWEMTPALFMPGGHGWLQWVRVTLATPATPKPTTHAQVLPRLRVPEAFALRCHLLLSSLHLQGPGSPRTSLLLLQPRGPNLHLQPPCAGLRRHRSDSSLYLPPLSIPTQYRPSGSGDRGAVPVA